MRLLGALLMEQHEHWTTGHRYVEMTTYWQGRGAQPSKTTDQEREYAGRTV